MVASNCPSCATPVQAGQRFCQECGTRLPETAAEDGEHKQVTAIFCDIVGSTAMAESIGSDAMHELLDRFFAVCAAAIGHYDGTINKFLGDGFLAFVGVPIAHEDHALRGVLAAMEVQERIADVWPADGDPVVRARIGINTGDVVVGRLGEGRDADFTAIGDTVNVASRLESLAEPGQVLISGATEAMVRGYINVEPLGELEVDGRAGTVSAYRAAGRGARRGRVDPGGGRRLSMFVGRRQQLRALNDLLDEVRSERGQVVGVVAEPGMGKSRLVSEFRAQVPADVQVREGRCLSYGGGTPLVPIADILRSLAGMAAELASEQAEAKLRAMLTGLGIDEERWSHLGNVIGLKAAAETLADLSPEAIRNLTFETLREVMLAESRRGPIVLVIEDLHWMDGVSQEVLASLVEHLQGARVMLLCTYRPGYQAPWMQRSYSTQLALPRLSQADAVDIVRSIPEGRGLSAAVAETIGLRADGNPFFVEELTRAFALASDGGESAEAVPPTVYGVLLARIDRLPTQARWLLRTASVLGRDFTQELLTQLFDGEEAIEPLLEQLQQEEFVYEEPQAGQRTYVFRHALTQDVAYSGLMRERRRELHLRAGEALERLYAGRLETVYDRLGHHYSEAGQSEMAVRYLSLSAERSLASYANTAAADALERALRHVDELPPELRQERALDLVFRLAYTYYLLGRFQPALDLLEHHESRMAELGGDVRYEAEFNFWLAYFETHLGKSEEAHRHAYRAIDLAGRCGDDFTAGRARYVLTREDFWLCRYTQGVTNGKRACALLRNTGEWWWLGHASSWGGLNHYNLGEFEEALAAVDVMNQIGRSRMDPRLQSYSDWNSGWFEATRGNWSEAIAFCTRSLAQSPDPLNNSYSTSWLGFAYREKGDYPRAIALLEDGITALRQFGYMRLVGWFSIWLGEAYLRSGRLEDAIATTSQGFEISTNVAYPWAIALGHRARGRIAERQGDPARAVQLLGQALEEFSTIDSVFDAAVTRLDLARIAATQDDAVSVRGHLSEAAAVFETTRAPAYLKMVENLERELGVVD